MRTHNLIWVCCLLLGVAGCANMSSGEQRTVSGAAIGAGAGALLGGLAKGRPLRGAAIGAAAGAAGGWLYDRQEQNQDR